MKKSINQGTMRLVAYRGDAKTLLAFDLTTPDSRKRLAGFTVRVTPPGQPAYFLFNSLQFEKPQDHAQDATEAATSTINAPIHKFRWVHVPGQNHQGLEPAWGQYVYAVTPRYFDAQNHLLPLDPQLTAAVEIKVAPFAKGRVKVGFTRGFTQSQAFTNHFGENAKIRPSGNDLLFDTSKICGTNAKGEKHTFAEQYSWSGFTARALVMELLDEALADATSSLDVFAYDLNEPDVIRKLLKLAEQHRVRIILDDAALHHSTATPKPEDKFADLFNAAAGPGSLKRGSFGRYSHDKVLVLRKAGQAAKVLTGSTNFSVTGFYVNSNHVLRFDDPDVAKLYGDMFEQAWTTDLDTVAFRASRFATQSFEFTKAGLPKFGVTFSPHSKPDAQRFLGNIVQRVDNQKSHPDGLGNVLFAVMELGPLNQNPVYQALTDLHKDLTVFSFGISDNPDGIQLYKIGQADGILVTGRPVNTKLPPPFNQVRNIGAFGHQVHHKFVVCDINGPAPIVFCGSSNLALAGEQVNGDNLLAIGDRDIATVFAIEALLLIDHFNFLDGVATAPNPPAGPTPPAAPVAAAAASGWFLGVTDSWSKKFFDPADLRCKDRILFAQ